MPADFKFNKYKQIQVSDSGTFGANSWPILLVNPGYTLESQACVVLFSFGWEVQCRATDSASYPNSGSAGERPDPPLPPRTTRSRDPVTSRLPAP